MTGVADRLTAALADRYRLEREVGAGGMATVFLAHDLKHDRDVALKVLHPELGAVIGAGRFLQEIKTTARLQHPHILGLIDSGEADGLLFYVMPFVRGESLRARLSRDKQLPIPEALRIATEVASALDYAHRHGVVHRDIKPENVLLHDGQAMVADFGIALAVTVAGGGRMTQTGMSLGTPHYMSPEQALGEKEITPRSDVYALGAMTYEMLTGDPPFTGSTVQAILAKVMTEKPVPPRTTRETVAPHVEAAILTALAKLPADRWGSAKEFADALANPALTITTAVPGGRALSGEVRRWRMVAAGLGAAVVLLAAAWAWSGTRSVRQPPPPVERFTVLFDHGVEPVDAPGSPIAFSPDGSRIAFLGQDSLGVRWLYVRALDQLTPTQIPGTRNALVPFFSADGLSLGFYSDGRLRKVSLAGGPISTICEIGYPEGAAWGPDGVIVLAVNRRLLRVAASGGQPELVAAPDSVSRDDYRGSELSPDGKTVLFTVVDSTGGAQLAGMSLKERKIVRLGVKGMSPHYVEAGYLAWTQPDGTLLTALFDTQRLRFTGPPQPVLEGVRTGPARVAKLGMARTGAFAYLGGETISRELVLTGKDGRTEVLPLAKNLYQQPRVSPDGRRIAVGIVDAGLNRGDIWVYELASGSLIRLTSDSISRSAEWMPDGKSILFLRPVNRTPALLSRPADGSGRADTVLMRSNGVYEVQIGRDGRTVVFRENHPETGTDIWLGVLDSLEAVRPLLVTRSNEGSIALSPSGALLAYVSDETGNEEVYIRELQEGSGKWRVSRLGGTLPRWAPSGGELFFRSGDSLFVSRIEAGPDPRPGPPRSVVELVALGPGTSPYDVMSDGRFVFARFDFANRTPGINVVLHWFEHLRSARPAAGVR